MSNSQHVDTATNFAKTCTVTCAVVTAMGVYAKPVVNAVEPCGVGVAGLEGAVFMLG